MTETLSRIKVVYIGGVEHNGSTFLGVTLGNHPQIECVGELSSLAREGWLADDICACGDRISDCLYWTKVKKKWIHATEDDIQSLVEQENAFDRHRRLQVLIKEKHFRSQRFSKYSDHTYALFQAIQQTSGKPVIVDTSKRFSRAIALSLVDGIELRVIHLVRDARGVAYSWTKPTRPRQRSWIDASVRWNITNTAFEYVKKNIGEDRVLRIRYEDFILNPKEALNEIGKFINEDLSSLALDLTNGRFLSTEHVGIGNGFLQRTKNIRLRSTIELL